MEKASRTTIDTLKKLVRAYVESGSTSEQEKEIFIEEALLAAYISGAFDALAGNDTGIGTTSPRKAMAVGSRAEWLNAGGTI